MSDLAVTAARGALWSALGRWGSKVLTLVTFALLARLLAPEMFGQAALAFAIVEVLRQIGQQGLTQALIRDPDLSPTTTHTAFWLNLGASCVLAAVLCVLAGPFESAMDSEGLGAVLRGLAGYLVLLGAAAVPEALLQRELRFAALAQRTLVATVVSAVVAVGLAIAGAGVWALVAQYLTMAAVGVVLVWRASGFRPRGVFSVAAARPLLRFGWAVLVIDLATAVALQGDNFVVSVMLGETALGYYSVAYRLMFVVVDLLGGVLAVLALPVFSRLQHEPPRLVGALLRTSKSTLLLAVPAFGLLAAWAPILVPAVFGEKWEPAVPVLQILCVGGVFYALVFSDRAALLAVGATRLEIYLTLLVAALTVVGAAVGAHWGLEWAAVGVAARMVVVPPVRLLVMRRALPIDVRRYLLAVAPLLFAGLVFATAVLGARAADSTATVLGAGVVGVLGFGAVVLLLDRPFVNQSIETARAVARRKGVAV